MIDDINTKRTELANQMAAAGAAALDFNATAAVLAAIPDTEPQQYVAAGTPENIAAILPATISPARRMRHGDRPTEALVFDEPAATSGDAPADGWPSEIYLNAGDDPLGHFDEYADVSWCDHPQGENDVRYVRAELARIERTTAHVQPVNTSSERVENAAGNDQVERAASPATASGDELPPHAGREALRLLAVMYDKYENGVQCYEDPEEGAGFMGTAVQLDSADECSCIELLKKYAPSDEVRAAVSAATKPTADLPRPSDDELWDATLRDRDTYHEWADKLAEAISKHFDAYIGEHSNANCPWAEALEAIEFYEDERPAHFAALLPGPYYMDPPDGGSVSILEQFKRMAEDAARWRSLLATKPAGAQAVPEGWKLVPVEPTEAMVHAAEDLPAPRMFGKVYRAMLAATPAASTIGAAQTAEQVRDQALEEAALAAEKVQDEYSERQGGKWPELRDDATIGARDCATAIRALKSSATQIKEGAANV